MMAFAGPSKVASMDKIVQVLCVRRSAAFCRKAIIVGGLIGTSPIISNIICGMWQS